MVDRYEFYRRQHRRFQRFENHASSVDSELLHRKLFLSIRPLLIADQRLQTVGYLMQTLRSPENSNLSPHRNKYRHISVHTALLAELAHDREGVYGQDSNLGEVQLRAPLHGGKTRCDCDCVSHQEE
jgi:hypothetical protein